MTEQDLREMIRTSIARQLGSSPGEGEPIARASRSHPSHVVLPLASGDAEGACLIEPAVRCNHCGFCQSYGH